MILLHLVVLAVLPTTWIVDASNGPGTSFTDLPAAVAAAASGDTIFVRPGIYSHFNVTGKALTIRGAGAATTTVQLAPPAGSTHPGTSIDAVPAGTAFYVGGVSFVAGYSIPAAVYPGLLVLGAGTEVALADVTASGLGCCAFGTPGLYLSGGAVVHADRCTFTGTPGYAASGGSGAVVNAGCKLAADECFFNGGGAGGGFFPTSGSGVVVQGGMVTLSHSNAMGGNATLGGPGGHGVFVQQNGFARISGGATTYIQGGQGVGGTNGYSVNADLTSSAVVHLHVSLQSATNGPVTTGAPVLPYVTIAGTPGGGGELLAAFPVVATFWGIPSAPFAVMVDVVPAFSTPFGPVAILGELLVPPPTMFALQGTLGQLYGMYQLILTPAVSAPALLDVPVYIQFAVLHGGQLRLSPCSIHVFKS